MDEVGLSTRSSGGSSGPTAGSNGGAGPRDHAANSSERQRPTSRQANLNAPHHAQQQGQQQQQQGAPYNGGNNAQFYNPLNAAASQANYDMSYGIPRSESVEQGLNQQFPAFAPPAGMFGANGSPMTSTQLQQLQFQQSMMPRAPPMNNYFPAMQAGFGGYQSPSPSFDQYRNQNHPNGSPIQPPGAQLPNMPSSQAQFAPPGFGINPMGMTGYGYGGVGNVQNMAYMQEPANPRRGRVGRSPQPDGRRRQ